MAHVQLTPDELIQEFQSFDDWNDRFQYLIELGDQLEPFPEEERRDENLVQGCQSNVWLVARVVDSDPPRMELLADSDSQLVRGLIAILMILLSGKTPQEVLQTDVESVFRQLELQRHLSRSRSNGFHSMVRRIRQLAEQYLQ
ncbi:MAG: cysteine desulfuration protein SufE [Pirellulaceae bacterium]|nr:MAG: cysteine desulfuration protein SufE [Pirellulaceae bacterium]